MSFTTNTTHGLSSGVLNIPCRGFVENVLGGGLGVDAFRSSGGGSTAGVLFERADGDVRGGVSGGVDAASSSDEEGGGKILTARGGGASRHGKSDGGALPPGVSLSRVDGKREADSLPSGVSSPLLFEPFSLACSAIDSWLLGLVSNAVNDAGRSAMKISSKSSSSSGVGTGRSLILFTTYTYIYICYT